ncbi:hypothetical protein EIN_267420 [Entamoeba invadens IP1]|uniref:Uncharacterized protein n=1 Tax=Entamoeba invadens IP1 TaxID=370355 RepID=A0A0A1U866_ENTIV|nr:hypothetical protein EIN_267420 [Entamoeba invadens IP1]ELP91026.1 hypothetical protein EIN_267420 [Entamoeba invadens IP1]|eukprot:XP_004257797.1 hypothetical protein EIN_267420 [Entamoeba invadens IP1]
MSTDDKSGSEDKIEGDDVSIDVDDVIKQVENKKRTFLCKEDLRNVKIFEVKQFGGLNNKIIVYETNKKLLLELKEVVFEYGSTYNPPSMLSGHNQMIATPFDLFFLALHFLTIEHVLSLHATEKQYVITSLIPEEFREVLYSVSTALLIENAGVIEVDENAVKEILRLKREAISLVTLNTEKQSSKKTTLDAFVKRVTVKDIDVLYPYVGPFWFDRMGWEPVEEEEDCLHADEYHKYAVKKKARTTKKKTTKRTRQPKSE